MATVALPAAVTVVDDSVRTNLTINAVTSMQMAMRAEPPVRRTRRPNRSARTQIKNVHAITLTAPKRPVSNRFLLPVLPTSSLKYWGPKTARALLPVVF
jgi:hypothetical protein